MLDMLDIINFYYNNVISPIECERNRLLRKVYSKNVFNILCSPLYKTYLDKTEELLFEKYKKLENIIKEETEFNISINNKIEP